MQFVAVVLHKLCCFTLFDNNWNSGRTHENAFEQHYQSVWSHWCRTPMIQKHFKKKSVTHNAVVTYIESLRK
jgi:hypothetical protein